jgi:purine nucleosidase
VQAAPDIAGRMTVLWIGGSLADGRFEYNHDTNPGAADLVLGHP